MKLPFDDYLFHCSALGTIMTNDKSGKTMGETCKKYLLQVWIEETYGRFKDIENKYMTKGTEVEELSMDLYCTQRHRMFKKNTEVFKNEFICGTPDILDLEEVIDLKSSWSLHTFYENVGKRVNSGYQEQLQGYMELTERKKARLAYVLVNTPLHLLEKEKSQLRHKMSHVIDHEVDPEYLKAAEMIDKNGTFDDIPEKERWMEFLLEKQPMDAVYERIKLCRGFLNQLSISQNKVVS